MREIILPQRRKVRKEEAKQTRRKKMDKQSDVMAILKLYELRRDEEMRSARKWYFSEFAPQNVMDILKLYRGGERASAYFRMVTSY